jgi:acetoin utilization protein AcuB
MNVQDCMQTPAITITPEEPVSTALQYMRGRRIRHLPVVSENQTLLGVVTDRDIRQAAASDAPHMATHELTYLLAKMTVKDIMTTPVVTVRKDTPIVEAGRIFVEKKFGCLPVVTEDYVLVGIVTVTDLLQAFVQQHAQ